VGRRGMRGEYGRDGDKPVLKTGDRTLYIWNSGQNRWHEFHLGIITIQYRLREIQL